MLYYTFKHPGNVGMVDPCLFYKKKILGSFLGFFVRSGHGNIRDMILIMAEWL
jgi:hypothetical protein